MISKKLLSPFQNIVLFNTLIKVSGIAKLSFIVGSQIAFFSAVAIMTPLSGAFAGISGCFSVFGAWAFNLIFIFWLFAISFLSISYSWIMRIALLGHRVKTGQNCAGYSVYGTFYSPSSRSFGGFI